MQDTQFQLLTKRSFLPLFVTQFFEAFNDSVFKNALIVLIAYRLTTDGTSEQLMVTLASGLFILPFFVFSALAGQIADKYEKAFITRIIKFFEIIFMLLGAYSFYTGNIPLMFFTLFLMGTHSAFFGPIKYAILPELLQEQELIGANALIESSTFIAILIGSIIGMLLILTNLGVTFISIVMVMMAIGGWVSSFFIPRGNAAAPKLKINWNLFDESWKIVKHTRENREVFLSILGISWLWAIGAGVLSQFPNFAKEVIGANQYVLTLFVAMFTIGITIGSLLCNRLLKGEVNSKFVPLGVLGVTVFIVDLYFASSDVSIGVGTTAHLIGIKEYLSSFNNYRILLDIVLLSICGGIFVVPLYAIMQTRSEVEHRSRNIACNNIINSFFMVLAAAFIMLMLELHATIPHVFLTLGIINTFVAIYICKLLPEAIIKSFVNWILRALFKVKVEGMDNYKAAGDRVIIIANHTSFLDIVLLSAFLPDKFTVAVNTDVAKKWWVRPLLSLVETYPIDPTSAMATKSIIKRVRAGKKTVIFPEGRLTTTGSLMKVYEGPAMIADKSGATLVPIRIDGGQYSLFSRLRGKVRIKLFPQITLTILPAQKFTIPEHLKGSQRRQWMGMELYKLMTDMMFESSPYEETLFNSLIESRAIYGGNYKIAEDVERKPMTYNQLIARSFILGNQIAKQTKRGDYVGILLPNMVATLVTFFAMHAIGRIPAMLNFSIGAKSLLSACNTAGVKVVYTSMKFVKTAKLEELVEKLQQAGIEVIYLESFRKTISLFAKLQGLLSGKFASYVYDKNCSDITPQDPAVILFTSGSEGAPKGVAHSHTSILSNVYQMTARVDFNSRDILFNALPVFHCFGLTVACILPTLLGIKTFYYPSPLHYRIVPEMVYDTNATIMFGTDTFLTGYARYAHPYDFYSVRYLFAGAEKLKPETYTLWAEKYGVRIFEGYGVTETAPVISTNTAMLNKVGHVGCFLPDIKYRLEPVEGIHEGGRLWVKGPNVMLGYLRPSAPGVIEALKDGWYDTGDIVDIDDEGYIKILGRAKRFAKIGGEMVSFTAVEAYLNKLWPDNCSVVVSIPDAKKGEQLVVVTDREDATREVILSFAREQGVGELYIPKKIKIVKEVPALATGKINYPEVQNIVNQDLGGDSEKIAKVVG